MTAVRDIRPGGGTKFYTPPILEPAKASEGRFVANRMENDVVMQRVSRDMYASESAGLREILANEITAARAARKLGAKPWIEVTVTRDRVVVWGMESLGMERRIFDDVFTVLGRSGNFDGKTPGQFGFGRAAYMTISDHMLLETRHRNGDRYTVLGVEGRGFQVDLDKPDIPFGTRVTLAPRPETHIDSLVALAREMAGRSDILITLVTERGTEIPERLQLNLLGAFFRTDLPDVEFVVAPSPNLQYNSFLCGIPIDFTYRGRHPVQVAVDIHDERKHAPTPDRERMTQEAEEAVSELIDAEIDRRLKGFPDDINGALEHPERRLAAHLDIMPFAVDRMHEIYTRRGREGSATLIDVAGSPMLGCQAFDRNSMRAVLAKHPNAVFVRNPPAGLTGMEELMERNGIKPLQPKKRKPQEERALVYVSGVKTSVDPENPPADLTIVRVADPAAIRSHGRMSRSLGVALTAHDVKGAVPVDEFTAGARAHLFETSRGTMTGEQLLDSREHAHRTGARRMLDTVRDAEARGDYLPVHGMLVWNDGTEEHERAYRILMAISCRLAPGFGGKEWGDETGVETYLRLDSPMLRRVMRECPRARQEDFCQEFLASEGKELLPP